MNNVSFLEKLSAYQRISSARYVVWRCYLSWLCVRLPVLLNIYCIIYQR